VTSAARFARRVDAFCARLNGGLAAVAIALAVVTAAVAAQRLAPLAAQIDPETGISRAAF
jgi:hypothetical protein